MPEWFENKGFWIDFFPALFPADRMAKAPEEVDSVLALASPQSDDSE